MGLTLEGQTRRDDREEVFENMVGSSCFPMG